MQKNKRVRKYRKISTSIWNDQKIRMLSHEAQYIFIRILTHQDLTSLGAIKATKSGLAEEFKIGKAVFNRQFEELLVHNLLVMDEEVGMIWAPNFLKHNRPESPNVVKHWANAYDNLPECELLTRVLLGARTIVLDMGMGFREAFSETFPQYPCEEGFSKTGEQAISSKEVW